MIARMILAAATLALPGVVQAQAYQCSTPSTVERVRPDLPSEIQPKRDIPIGSYTLAITWAPQYCRDNGDRASSGFQCGSGNRFGFTLHGLWPDGVAKDWPQYCRAAEFVPPPVIRAHLCTTLGRASAAATRVSLAIMRGPRRKPAASRWQQGAF